MSERGTHGRRAHKHGGGCDTGRKGYPTKRAAEQAEGTDAERCDRCRQWHAKRQGGGRIRRTRTRR